MPVFPATLPAFDGFLADVVIAVLDHVALAIQRLAQEYQKLTIQDLLGIITQPLNAIETAGHELLDSRYISTGAGAQLDVIGRIIGQPRNGLSDDQYRLYLMARVLINKSDGTAEDVYSVFRQIIPVGQTMTFVDFYPASFEFTLGGPALDAGTAGIFATILRQTRMGGVGGWLIWSESDSADTFTLDGTSAQSLDAGGLAEASN